MKWIRWMFLLGAAAPALAGAQQDVGLVNLVTGEVAYQAAGAAPGKVRPFMKLREGDRLDVPGGAQVRVVYFDGSRQERWSGPAAFRAGRNASTPISGVPAETGTIPSSVPQRIARIPELVENARLGGIQVRGVQPVRPPNEEAIREARGTYDRWRKEAAADDITPELYLFAALGDSQRYDEMGPVLDEMKRRQPQSDDVRALEQWLKTRRGR